MKKIIRPGIKLILAYLTAVSMGIVTGYGITGIEIMLPCIFALALIVYHKADVALKVANKRDIISAIIVGVIFALGVVVGSNIDVWEQTISPVGIKDIVACPVLAVFFSAVVLLLFGFIDKKRKDSSDVKEELPDKATFFRLSILMIVCWIPYYLTMLPGNLGKDTFESIDMCLGRIPWTNHHPIFFTSLINIVIKLTSFTGSITFSMAVFTFLHMVVVALTLSYLSCKLCKRYRISVAICFALHPVVAMFSIYISKDVLFSCAMVMLVLKLYDIVKADDITKKDGILLGIYALLTMLLRNNGLLIVCVLAIVMAIVYRKSLKVVLPALLVPIIIFMIFKKGAYAALNISPESFAESASIPLQQVGYVIVNSDNDSFADADDVAFLKELMPFDAVKENFELGYTDSYKFADEFNDEFLNSNKGQFMVVWLHMLPGHFTEYVDAYLAQTAGYWHYGETNTLCTQGIWEDNEIGVERVDVIKNITGISLFGIIEKLMLGMRKAPLLCILTSMAMQFYFVLLLAIDYKRCGRYKRIIALLPLLILWVSIMIATPAFCLFRYTYPMFLLWPLTIQELIEETK